MNRMITTPGWVKGRTLYEVNLRQYTPGGTFKEFEDHLWRLKELGIGILWFMPIHPIGKLNRKGSLGSYYSISNYRETNPEFGTLEDFKRLVGKAHDMDMKVIIDWVANHTAWDHHWTKDHPEYYSKDDRGSFRPPFPDWEDVIHLNYDNRDLWKEMTEAMTFWLTEAGIDGFRCDMAHLVPTPFWDHTRRELDRVKPVFMLAESENHDLLVNAFDAIYNWKLLHAMNDFAAGKITAKELLKKAMNELNYLPAGASFLNFTSNHDENSWQGSAPERLGNFLEPLTVLTFMLPGIPLVYSGQEAGNKKRLSFFEKDEIKWEKDEIALLFQKLAKINNLLSCSNTGTAMAETSNSDQENLVRFVKNAGEVQLLVLINFSDRTSRILLGEKEPDNDFKVILSSAENDPGLQQDIEIESYGFRIMELSKTL